MKVKAFLKKNKFIIAIVIIVIIKQILVSSIPITAFPSEKYDDDMMVNMAVNIRAGHWLGDYTSDTLVKGPMFPLMLAVMNFSGLSYIGTMNIIYTLACAFFVYSIKDIIKSKKLLFLIFTVLIFNPVSYAAWTMQRVYRNGVTLSQVLIIIGSLFMLYQRRHGKIKEMILPSIIGGLTLGALWLTREDGIWIIPFVVIVMLVTIISILIKNKEIFKDKKRSKEKIINILTKIVIVILPIIILFISLNCVRLVNYKKYGVYEYNEINDGYFGKVIKTIYSIKTDEDIQYVSATRNKINIAYENSNTLFEIKDKLEQSLNSWDGNDRHPGDTQVEDGWFWWALKQGVESSEKYVDAKTSNDFFKQVYEELNKAIKEGKIPTQSTMPSNLMSPWKNSYFIELPKAMAEIAMYVINFEEVKTTTQSASPINYEVRKYESMTNDFAMYPPSEEAMDPVQYRAEKYVNRVNKIGNIYKMAGLAIAIIGVIGYIIMTIEMIKNKGKNKVITDMWLIVTGILGSLIVLIGGVSYNHITACFSKYYMYLSGAYPLVIAFSMINISYIIQKGHGIYKMKNKGKVRNKNKNNKLNKG